MLATLEAVAGGLVRGPVGVVAERRVRAEEVGEEAGRHAGEQQRRRLLHDVLDGLGDLVQGGRVDQVQRAQLGPREDLADVGRDRDGHGLVREHQGDLGPHGDGAAGVHAPGRDVLGVARDRGDLGDRLGDVADDGVGVADQRAQQVVHGPVRLGLVASAPVVHLDGGRTVGEGDDDGARDAVLEVGHQRSSLSSSAVSSLNAIGRIDEEGGRYASANFPHL